MSKTNISGRDILIEAVEEDDVNIYVRNVTEIAVKSLTRIEQGSVVGSFISLFLRSDEGRSQTTRNIFVPDDAVKSPIDKETDVFNYLSDISWITPRDTLFITEV